MKFNEPLPPPPGGGPGSGKYALALAAFIAVMAAIFILDELGVFRK